MVEYMRIIDLHCKIDIVKLKAKLSVCVIKPYAGMEVQSHAFLLAALDGGSLTLRPLYSRGNKRVSAT